MKKTTFFSIYLFCVSCAFGQTITFDKILPLPPAPANIADIMGVSFSSVAFCDIDGDSDKDILVTGENPIGLITQLYKNDGVGNFTIVSGMPFVGVKSGCIDFSDIDNDNDQDLLVTGNSSNGPISQLFNNDGLGNFSLISGTPFTAVTNSAVMFCDVDNDGDEDVLIAGSNLSTEVAELYFNDGLGNFSLAGSTPFVGVSYCSLSFTDVDGDNDKDVLIAGIANDIDRLTNLYTNDGLGGFTFNSSSQFEGVYFSSIDFADIDADNDQDVIVIGTNISGASTRLYKNNGSGTFSMQNNASFENISNGDVEFVDIDNDNDQDVIISGTGYDHTVKLYSNDGSGVFSFINSPTIEASSHGSLAFEDVDSDGDQDVLITGTGTHIRSQLYFNDGVGNFDFAGQSSIRATINSSMAFSDIDNDGDQDALVTGSRDVARSELYKNDGLGNFSVVNNIPFQGVNLGAVAFSDIDNDNDEDLIITGGTSASLIAQLFKNDGLGNFSLVGSPFIGVHHSSVDFADIDNDGDEDVLITGSDNSFIPITQLYKNDGFGNFSSVNNLTIEASLLSSVEFSDIDGDNDLDVIVAGWNNQPVTKLYTNDGVGNFTLVNGTPFIGLNSGALAFNDIDSDGDNDVLMAGTTGTESLTVLYLNDGLGNFSVVNNSPFQGGSYGTIDFGDVDGDNDDDLLITGINDIIPITKLYENDGLGNYILSNSFPGVWSSSASLTDLDGDNHPDIAITGLSLYGAIARVFRNTTCFSDSLIDTHVACDSFTWIDGNTYIASNNTATYTLVNQAGCNSVVTLDLTIIPSLPLSINTFSLPSDANNCLGSLVINTSGNPDFTSSIDGAPSFTHSGYHLEQNLCVGVHDLSTTDGCGNPVNTTFIIPVDTNYVFNNPFIDSIVVDSLGVTIENCNIYYNSIDTAFIDSIWANGNTVTVIWNIVDSSGSNFDTSAYVLNNGNGVYYLQLSVFCPTKALGEYFTVTEAIYFNNGSVSTASVSGIEEMWFDIHPNPTNDQVFVHFDGQQAQLKVTDAFGKLIYSDELNSGSPVSLANKPSGVYFFQLTTEKGGAVRRVVKN